MVQVRVVGLDALRSRIRRLADLGPITESLRLNLSNAWSAGADAFIRAAIRQVLVDTGMSAASFFPLARSINRVKGQAAIRSHIARKRKRFNRKGEPTFPSGRRRSGGFQSEVSGERLGKRAFIFRVPRVGSRKIVFAFSFSTVVFQLSFHEDIQQALPEGIIAFEQAVRIRFVRDARFIVRQFLKTGRPPRGLLRTIE